MRPHVLLVILTLGLLSILTSCSPREGTAAATWDGTIDTLPSGHVVVSNTARPLWREGDEWRVVEELRIGTLEGNGPDLFGNITSLEVDPAGRIYVLEGQAQEIRVFNPDGSYLRTVGRRGGGPGEFARAVLLQFGPDGRLWVADPENNRVSLFDTSGTFIEGRRQLGGFIMLPWPGGFDRQGTYHTPIPLPSEHEFEVGLIRYDRDFNITDTLVVPRDPVERERFELRSGDSYMMAGIPFSPGFLWHLSPVGTLWGMFTGQYRLFELSQMGDTLRSITREFEPLPVTDEDLEAAAERLEWFTQQGGKIDLTRVPDSKPATTDFFFDDAGNIWVVPVTPPEDENRVFDVFDPAGRYLGAVRLPFAMPRQPYPLIREGVMYAVTPDELDVPYVVRARIEKPSTNRSGNEP